MADTFGLTTSGEVVVQQTQQPTSGPQTRLSGGQSASPTSQATVAYAPGGNFEDVIQDSRKTMDALNKLTQGALKPYIEAEQKKAYVNGMVAVAQGKSIVDVQKEQPWFTEIFGPSATVRGAQAMTTMGALDEAKTKFLTDMSTLRTQSPDAVRQYLVEQVTKIGTTGDGLTDAMVQQKLAEQMPGLMDVHMREHLKYIQEANSNAYQNSGLSAGRSLQAMINTADASMPQQLRDNEFRYMSDAWAPIPGQNQESWKKDVMTVARANLQEGNFAAVEVLQKSPHWQALDAEAKQQIEALIPTAREYAKVHSPTLRTDVFNANVMENQLALGNGPQTMDDLHTWMDAKDKKFQVENGTSTPYFSNAQRSALEDKWFQGMRHRAAQRDAILAGEADITKQTEAAWQGVNTMIVPPADGSIKSEVKNSVMSTVYGRIDWQGETSDNQNTIDKFAVASTWGSDYIVPQVKGRWSAAATQFLRDGANLSEETQATLTQWRKLLDPRTSNGAAALNAYIGAENAAKVTALLNMSPDITDPAKLNAGRKAINQGYAEVPHQADREAAVGIIDKETPGILGRIFGSAGQLSGINLNDGAKYKLSRDLADSVARFRRIGLSDDKAAQAAFDMRYGGVNGADFVSGVIVDRGTAPSTLANKLVGKNGGSQGQEDYQLAVTNTWRGIVKDQVLAQGGAKDFDPSRLTAVFGTNLTIGGKVAIQLQVQDKKTNKMYTVTFNEDQVGKTFDGLAASRATRTRNRPPALGQQPQSNVVETGFGPTIVR